MNPLRLHSYWRSTASYRVRIALNLKQLPYELITHDLRTGAQKAPEYLDIDPQGLVPALETGRGVIMQSLAIIEWLEDAWPTPALYPEDPYERAVVRAMADIVACDIHPLNNLRVLARLREHMNADDAAVSAWIADWIVRGFDALEIMVKQHGRGFAFKDTPTAADCFLVPQIYSARRFSVDMQPYPALREVASRAETLEPFLSAHPDRQSDAD